VDSAEDAGKKSRERCELLTSGVVSTREGRRISLLFSGSKHAGENLSQVLAKREKELICEKLNSIHTIP
jgi:hypothetical protein